MTRLEEIRERVGGTARTTIMGKEMQDCVDMCWLLARVEELVGALSGLGPTLGDGLCFCSREMRYRKSHQTGCSKARAALAKLEESESQRS